MQGRESAVIRARWIFVVAVAIMFFRMPDRFIHGFLWAEDGPQMIQIVFEKGRLSFLATFPGYAVLIPKLISYVSMKLFPLPWLPWIFVFSMAAAWASMCTVVYAVAAPRLGNVASAVLALFPTIAPHAGEVFLNLTNFQWLIAPCLAACLWAAAQQQVNKPAALAAAIFFLSLTGPFSVLMAPLVTLVWLAYRRPVFDRRCIAITLAYVIPVLFQAYHMFLFGRGMPQAADVKWFDEYMVYAVGNQFVGSYVMSELAGAAPWVGAVLFVLSFASVLTSRSRALGIAILAFGTAVWVSAMMKMTTPDMHLIYNGNGSRYVYPMDVALFSTMVIAGATARYRATRWTAVFLGSLLALTGLTTFFIPATSIRWSYSADGSVQHIVAPPEAGPGPSPWQANIPIKE